MTKDGAMYSFFAGFGIRCYEASNVPADAALPYLTYTGATGSIADGGIGIEVNVWYADENNTAINAKARQITNAIGRGGTVIACDDGGIWLKPASPFCSAKNEQSTSIRRRTIKLEADFLTQEC